MRLTFLILALASVAHSQRFRFSQVPESVVMQREQQGPLTPQDRESRIKLLFLQAGCAAVELNEQPLDKLPGANVICRLPGKSKETIIVGATYSQMPPDNWSGASLLASLFQTLASRRRHHTFVFVAFADGGNDLAGSHFFVDHMSRVDVDQTEAMVNLEALGFSPTKISSSESDKQLVHDFMTVTYALRQMASQVDVSKGVHVDSEPFAFMHIPQITIHSLTRDAVADLPSQDKDRDKFRPHFYYNSYTLVSGYLAYLDEVLKPRHHGK
ncbi:MAG TPA: hypothetical protein VI636_23200 [Candidatus Angelobacter sp.]